MHALPVEAGPAGRNYREPDSRRPRGTIGTDDVINCDAALAVGHPQITSDRRAGRRCS